MAAPIPEGMTELYDADVPRVDLVDKGANGMPFLIAKSEAPAGMFGPHFVRELLHKEAQAPESTQARQGWAATQRLWNDYGWRPDQIEETKLTPAQAMALVHAATVRKEREVAAPSPAEEVEKAEASTATMNDRPDSDFAYVEAGGTKDESGKTVPRSLRHYPIYDEAHARNALGRAGAQIEDGDEDAKRIARAALPKIRAAAKKFGIEVEKTHVEKAMETDDGIDGMDPTVALAEPDMEAPGDPADPGSPAWEAIDAATARKWTAILARARTAIGIMSDREMLEAAAGDEDDAMSAMDLDDACCAIDYAISVLAPFAVDEQAEADCGTAEMEMLGKALGAFDAAPLETVEAFGPLTKAGRTLSAANEAALRAAITSLQQIIASLPAAPAKPEAGEPVTKTANEEPNMDTPTPTEDVTAASGQEPAMGSAAAEPKPVAGQAVTDMAKSEEVPVEKAPKLASMMPVYNSNGDLVGVVDPAEVTQLTGSSKDAPADTGTDVGTDDGAADGDDGTMAAVQPADDGTTPTDLAPAPADAVGTPADATTADDDGNVAKAETPDVPSNDMLKSSIDALVKAALDDYSAKQADVVKGLETRAQELEEQNKALTEALTKQAASYEERLATLENAPAVMAIASNGAVPPAHLLRGQDRGGNADLSGSALLKAKFRASDDAREQKAIADEMQERAINAFAAMQRRP